MLRRAIPALLPARYAELLGEKPPTQLAAWLVNTGWTGGPYGQGERMPIAATRSMLHAALSGRLESGAFRTDEVFGFEVPEKVPGVDTKLLDPRSTWRDPEAYDEQAARLAQMFVENFTKFGDAVDPEIAAAAPRS